MLRLNIAACTAASLVSACHTEYNHAAFDIPGYQIRIALDRLRPAEILAGCKRLVGCTGCDGLSSLFRHARTDIGIADRFDSHR